MWKHKTPDQQAKKLYKKLKQHKNKKNSWHSVPIGTWNIAAQKVAKMFQQKGIDCQYVEDCHQSGYDWHENIYIVFNKRPSSFLEKLFGV